jgi:hypothetical protein
MGLSDILRGGDSEDIRRHWDEAEPAPEMEPLPAGEYDARIVAGELFESRTNRTPGYRLTFAVIDGEFAGRRFWHESWLTPAAMPQAKRDLGKLGIERFEQLDLPLPRGIRCRCKLALRRTDDGNEYNRVRSFEVTGIDPPESDPFAPAGEPNPDDSGPSHGNDLAAQNGAPSNDESGTEAEAEAEAVAGRIGDDVPF